MKSISQSIHKTFLPLSIFVITLLVNMPSHSQDVLDSYRWENRLLLIFSGDAHESSAQSTKNLLEKWHCELDDRDLMIGWIYRNQESKIGDSPIAHHSAEQIRTKFKITADEFTVILIGKDGGEKSRSYGIPELPSIFDLIDGMPMRMAEMRQKGEICQ